MSLTIDSDVFKEAKQLGINVSQASENYIKLLIQTIKGKAGGEGFEPSTPNLGDYGGSAYWRRFADFIATKKYRGGYDRTLFNYAQKYSDCLFKRDLTPLQSLVPSMRPNILKALAALAKFSGRYEEYQSLLKSSGIGWAGRNKDDVFIERLTGVKDSGEVWEWVKAVKTERTELTGLMDLMSVSGLRFIEGVASHNLIIELNTNMRLGEYFKENALEHFHFKELFLRQTKKAFVSFVPSELVMQIYREQTLGSLDSIKKQIQKSKLPLRFSDIREAHATFMTKFLKPSEIDFLHGRVTSSVFMANYFNPALIGDLRERAFKGITEIQEKIKTWKI